MYLQRVSIGGMAGAKYWNSYTWNHGAGTKNKMPNCTCFAIGEVYEETEADTPFRLFRFPYQNPGAFPAAKDFYSNWIGEKGVEPKVGGVAVWGSSRANQSGHVAIVLDVLEDLGSQGTKIRVCQSNFGGAYFEVKEYTVRRGVVTPGVGCPYFGCCYVKIADFRTARNEDLNQVKVKADYLQVRNRPNGEIYLGRKCPNGIYNILSIRHEGSYDWAELDEGFWIALNDEKGWTETYTPDDIFKRYEALKCAYERLSEQYTELLKKVKE